MSAAAQPADVKAEPFLRWTGSKRKLLSELMKHVPPTFGTYYEPFVGSGALFFELRPERAVLSDANKRLIRTYVAVRDYVENVIGQLQYAADQHSKEFYHQVRDTPVDHLGDVGVAAWFIYLNRTCFNGLWRENQSGKFNVPMGDIKNPAICDADKLRRASAALQGVRIKHADYESVDVPGARAGDFVYFDPPYVPASETSDFTAYTAGGFTDQDQQELRDLAYTLKRRGVHVLLSNSATPRVRELYADGFQIREVTTHRSVSADASRRGGTPEFIIW